MRSGYVKLLRQVGCVSECVTRSCVLCLWRHGAGFVPASESSETSAVSAALSILSKIIEKKGCNSLCPGDWTGRDGRVTVFSQFLCEGGEGGR